MIFAIADDYYEIPFLYYNFPFDVVGIFGDNRYKGIFKYMPEKRNKGAKRGKKSAREHIVSFPLAALGGAIMIKRLFWKIRTLYVLKAPPSVYES